MRKKHSGRALAIACLLAVSLLVAGCGDDDSTPTTPTQDQATTATGGSGGGDQQANGGKGDKPAGEPDADVPTIDVVGGQPEGGVQELSFDEGDDIRFIVKSDVADEVHLHGYDVMMDVEAGGQVEFDVPATITGVFEVELEESVVPLAEITVNPG
jgi:hypothetical protein